VNVVVAGRVSAFGVVVDEDEEGWAAGAFVAADVPEETDCALALAAAASSSSDARDTRRIMVGRLQSHVTLIAHRRAHLSADRRLTVRQIGGLLSAAIWAKHRRLDRLFRCDQPAASTATDLAAFAPGIARLVGRPFVRCSLFMRGAPAFAGDLALFFRRHRRKPATFFSFRCIHCTPP